MAAILGNAEQAAAAQTRHGVTEVVWSDTALDQLDAIGLYIERFNPKAAEEVAAHLIAAGNGLGHFPHRGRLVPGTGMRELVTSPPYVIRYRVVDDTVQILRVRHTPRRPTNP